MSNRTAIIAAALAAALLLAGCGEERKSAGQPAQAAAPAAPGTITVSAGKAPAEQDQDRFRSLDVKGEAQISYAPAGQTITREVRNVQVVVATRNRTPLELIGQKLLVGTLSKDFMVWCSACHDDYGNGVIGPSIMDKSARQIRDRIEEYRGNPDANVLMTDLVNRMSREKIEFISGDIASFNERIKALRAKQGVKP